MPFEPPPLFAPQPGGPPLPFPFNQGNGFGGTRLPELDHPQSLNGTELRTQKRQPVSGEWVNSYATALAAMKPAAENLDGHAHDWDDIHNSIANARQEFFNWLDQSLKSDAPDNWRGATATAIVNKAKESLGKLDELALAAHSMGIMMEAFGHTITATRSMILAQEKTYNEHVLNRAEGDTPGTQKDTENLLNLYAQDVIRTLYNPSIESINQKHPDIGTSHPTVGVPGAGPPGLGVPRGAGGPGGPGGMKNGGLGAPEIPSPNGLAGPGDPDAGANGRGMPSMPAVSPQGAGDAANGAGNTAGQGANAANQALNQASKGGQQHPAGLPGGMATPIANRLNRVAKAGGSGGARGGGGAATRGPSLGKPAAQLTPVTKTAAAAAVPASRAGISGGSGAPVAGAPAAGHQGGKAGREHRAGKALRHTKHGQDVIGEADAVVPVVGGGPQETAAANPGSPA
ncbi:hypothetical protein A9W99_23165 [Mycobacterium sp. 1164966.3]|nr:hypothetical protein A9W99_23165 [Mycobacterium sp. 1164966.3]